jgi:flagellar basal-body rod protein FlgG
MIRALYTAASGMNAQQTNIDNIAHNLSNVNTAGFKKSRVEFEDLVYQQITQPGSPTSTSGESPVGLRSASARAGGDRARLRAGNMRATSAPLDLAIEGRGFFQVTLPDGQTRVHARRRAAPERRGRLVTAEGYRSSRRSRFPRTPRPSASRRTASCRWRSQARARRRRSARSSWRRSRTRPGLQALGGNLFVRHDRLGRADDGGARADGIGTVLQGFLEESNVSVVEEMVNMILGQRAYEANSRVVTGGRRDARPGQPDGAVGMAMRLLLAGCCLLLAGGPIAAADSGTSLAAALVAAVQARMGEHVDVTVDQVRVVTAVPVQGGRLVADPQPGSQVGGKVRFALRFIGDDGRLRVGAVECVVRVTGPTSRLVHDVERGHVLREEDVEVVARATSGAFRCSRSCRRTGPPARRALRAGRAPAAGASWTPRRSCAAATGSWCASVSARSRSRRRPSRRSMARWARSSGR